MVLKIKGMEIFKDEKGPKSFNFQDHFNASNDLARLLPLNFKGHKEK